jgi:hypothetical protein
MRAGLNHTPITAKVDHIDAAADRDDANYGPPPLIWFHEETKILQRDAPDDVIQHVRQKRVHGKSAARTVSERMRTEREKDDDDDPDYLPMRQHQAIRKSSKGRGAKSSSQSHSVPHHNATSILHLDDDTTPSSTSNRSHVERFFADQQSRLFVQVHKKHEKHQLLASTSTMPQLQDTELRQLDNTVSFQKIISTSKFQGQITKQAISSEQRF